MKKFLCILLLTGFLVNGCEQQEKATVTPSGNVVKIGFIAPMSGPEQQSGENGLLGIRTALQIQPYLNNGDKIELVVEDSKGSSEQIGAALKKLSGEDINGVLLMAKSDAVLSIVSVADTYKTPILALKATHPDITKNNRFISQLGFDDIFQGTVAALYVRDEMLVNRVAVFSDQKDAHYSFLANEFIRKYTSVGGETIEHIFQDTDPGDMQKTLERLRDKQVQLLYLAVSPEQVVNLARTAVHIGWNPQMMGSDGLLASIILQHPEELELVNGMLATDFYSTILPKNEYAKKAVRIFNKLFSEPGTTYTALGCEGTSILLNAVDRCDNKTNKSCVNYMLRNTKEFEGLLGKIAVLDNGKAERPVFVNVIEDRKMKFLVKVY